MLGFRFISWLLLSASSTIDTRPRCFTNLATAPSSSGDIYINFPRSSTTPARINNIHVEDRADCSLAIFRALSYILILHNILIKRAAEYILKCMVLITSFFSLILGML
jgi:hypothetical protein